MAEATDDTLRDVVAIDGPSGSGKSTVARALARRLGFAYLDTGAMYRAVTWFLLERGAVDVTDEAEVGRLLQDLDLQLTPAGEVLVGGRNVAPHLRSQEVEARVSVVSAQQQVRALMRTLQRQQAAAGPIVAEGRDMGSVVFPRARWKVYLDADPGERARRRREDFRRSGREVSEAEVLEEMAVRDRLDSTRRDAPLQRTDDAIYCDTTGRLVEAIVEELADVIGGAP